MTELYADFPEMAELFRCADLLGPSASVQVEAYVRSKDLEFPLVSFHFGNADPTSPALVFVGGIHGLEKIGSQIILSFLRSWIRLLRWDQTLVKTLEDCRIIFYPIANPIGMYLNQRSNASGVDLMRNAPVDADDKVYPLVGGHRLSPKLPWYRGTGESSEEEGMEAEAKVLVSFIRKHCFSAKQSLVLDVHSGFGWIDRVWFPYASSKRPFPKAGNVLAIKQLLDRSYPHHVYKIEPQNHSYMTHGDLWDYLYFEQQKHAKNEGSSEEGESIFLPLCLEMGSWPWIKKNPRQLFSSSGFFNPILPHRIKRAERRHFLLFNFLVKAIASGEAWDLNDPKKRHFLTEQAKNLWYS